MFSAGRNGAEVWGKVQKIGRASLGWIMKQRHEVDLAYKDGLE